MDVNQVKNIEERCKTMSFSNSTANVPHLRPLIIAWPSTIVQSRIEYDILINMKLEGMAPLQLMRVSELKRVLINILETK